MKKKVATVLVIGTVMIVFAAALNYSGAFIGKTPWVSRGLSNIFFVDAAHAQIYGQDRPCTKTISELQAECEAECSARYIPANACTTGCQIMSEHVKYYNNNQCHYNN